MKIIIPVEKAMQEQQEVINIQGGLIAELRKEIDELKRK